MSIELLLWIAGGLFVYFFPTYVAFVLHHNDWKGVFFVNLLLGWTILLWFVALVWSIDPGAKN